MRKLSIAVLIVGIAVAVALTGCGGGGGGGGPTPPPTNTYTVTGRVVDYNSDVGVANVLVKFGTAQLFARTDSNGKFSIDTHAQNVFGAFDLVSTDPFSHTTFTVSTEYLPQVPDAQTPFEQIYPASYPIVYDSYPSTKPADNPDGNYRQDAVWVPLEVLNGSTTSLGKIRVMNANNIPGVPGWPE